MFCGHGGAPGDSGNPQFAAMRARIMDINREIHDLRMAEIRMTARSDVDPSTVSTTVVARAGAIPRRSDVSPAATAAGAAAAQGVVVARGAHSATAVQVADSRDASPRMSVPSASATCTATASDDRHGRQGPTETAAGAAAAQGVGVARGAHSATAAQGPHQIHQPQTRVRVTRAPSRDMLAHAPACVGLRPGFSGSL